MPRPASDGSEQTAEDGARPEDGPVGRLRSVLPGGGSDWLLVAVGVGLGLLVVTDGSPLARLVRGLLLVAALRSALLATTGHNLIRLTGEVTGVVLGLAFGVRYSAFGAWEWRTVIGWIELAAGVTLLTVALVDIGRGRTFILLSGQRLAALLECGCRHARLHHLHEAPQLRSRIGGARSLEGKLQL